MTTLEYKGYVGSVTFDAEAEILHGTVVNTRDVITFQGKSVSETKAAFEDSVEDYLEFCAELGREPEKPMSGKFNVRISPLLHAQAVATAASAGLSLNSLVEQALEEKVGRRQASATQDVAEVSFRHFEEESCHGTIKATFTQILSRSSGQNIRFTPQFQSDGAVQQTTGKRKVGG
ncbi:type II toxin-antitoxin system HicB family antitoxin [Deinococcus radiophilus]|uniref:type II toxin-antitoxin system HicB family antitoxin n=1 Tax=Deinococcus radiophilus TaxID=32062 RepID=UPI001F281987|nr:type II toxin-antitoxin system HicB family antitoxin [Deinococcus radiophilus]